MTKTSDEHGRSYEIRLPLDEAATFDAALQSHRDALVAEWKRAHAEDASEQAPSFPTAVDGFMSLIKAGWDTDVARRPHGQHTTVVVHVDVKDRIAALHLGPVLSDADRRYLLCDATCEAWFERDGQVIGHGRRTRTVGRRLRRALEHRDRTCVVPGCGATRGLHAHHLQHWEDGAWSSPTAPGENSDQDPWPDHPPDHRHRSRPTRARPENAPTGGGTTPSNHHPRPPTRSAGDCR